MTTQQTTPIDIQAIIQYARPADSSLEELTKLRDDNRRILACGMQEIVDKWAKNDKMFDDKHTTGLEELNARLSPVQSTESSVEPSATHFKFNPYIVAGIIIGLIAGVIVARIYGEFAAPKIKGSSLDFGAVVLIVIFCGVMGDFFGSWFNDRRNKK